MEQNKLSPRTLLIWGLIMASGAILLFTGITNESLWYDESYTGALVKQSLADIINITGGDNHPPLYYLILRIFTWIFGNTVFSLRAFSVIGALSLAALGIGPVRRAMGDRTGILFTILTLTMPITISMAQEARMYTWAAFLVTGSALYGYFCHNEGKTKDWILFGVFSATAAYTHYYALLAIMFIWAIIFAAMIIKKKKLLPYLYTATAMVIAYIPWLFKLLGAVNRVKGSYWIPPVTRDIIERVFTYPFSNKFTVPVSPSLPAFGYMIAAIIISWGVLSQITRKDKNAFMAVISILTYLFTIIAGIAASWIIRPVLVERYMVPALGLFIMALSYGMANLGKNITPTVIAGLLILAVSGIQVQHTLANRFNGPMKEAVQTLQVQPDDIFLHTDEHTIGTFSYYYPNNMNYYYVRQGNGGFSNFDAFRPNGVIIRSLDEIPKDRQVWLVYRSGGTDSFSAPTWVNTGKLKSEGSPVVFRLPLSWYNFMVYKTRFPESSSTKTDVKEEAFGNLTVRTNGFRNDTGRAIVLLYENGPMDQAPSMSRVVEIKADKAEAIFENLPWGNYAVLVFHDGNNNQTFDMKNNLPTEGIGYSNQLTAPSGSPEYEKSMISLDKTNLTIDIPIFYFD